MWVVVTSILTSPLGCGDEDHFSPPVPPGTSSDRPIKDRSPDFLYAGETGLPSTFLARLMSGVGTDPVDIASAGHRSVALPLGSFRGDAALSGPAPTAGSVQNVASGWLELPFSLAELGMSIYEIYHATQESKEIKEINDEVQEIQGEVDELNGRIDALATELAIDFAQLNLNDTQKTLQTYITAISNAYGIFVDDLGNTQYVLDYPYSLYYFTRSAASSPDDVPQCTDDSTETVCENLEIFMASDRAMETSEQIRNIYDLINPGAGNQPYLMIYANYILLNGGSADPEPLYRMLEAQFAKLINYQLQALVVYSNYMNYVEPNGTDLAEYVQDEFIPFVTGELQSFLKAADYLVANTYDYRSADQYKADMQYVDYGLAGPDDDSTKVLARSRFVCATILSMYDQNPGLAGTILLPYDYTNGGSIGLAFSSGGTSYTYSLAPTDPERPILGQFPYTKWTGSTATPDNRWLSYDLNFCLLNADTGRYETVAPATYSRDPVSPYTSRPVVPPGTYTVSVVDYGPQSDSWIRADTADTLGTVTVSTYDTDGNPVDNPTQQQIDDGEVVTFSHFALNWPWNFQRLCATPYSEWTVLKNTYQKWDSSSGSYINAVTYSEPVLNRLVIDGLLESRHKFPDGGWEYKIQLPIEVSGGLEPSDVFDLMYHSPAGGNGLHVDANMSDELTASFKYTLEGLDDPVDDHKVKSPDKNDNEVTYSSPEVVQAITGDTATGLTIDSTFEDTYSSISAIASRYGKTDLSWSMQIVFRGNYTPAIE